MKFICITALTLAAGALGAPLAAAEPSLQTEKNGILDQHQGVIEGDEAKKIASEVGAHFDTITESMRRANAALYHLDEDTELVDEDGKPCDATCIRGQTQQVIKHAVKAILKSYSKLGLIFMGEHISPSCHSLNVLVQKLDASVVFGALGTIPARMNGAMVALDEADAWLGDMGEKEKQRDGGPRGLLTRYVHRKINNRLGEELGL